MKALFANWKMNIVDNMAAGFIDRVLMDFPFDKAESVICAPHTVLPVINNYLKNNGSVDKIKLGAQNISEHDSGAYTGETSAQMVVDAGAKYVILGHSERRQYFLESDDLVYKKALKVQSLGLNPIVCIGENLKEREAGSVENVIVKQLSLVLEGLKSGELKKNLYIAYEPIWAIGTGVVATEEQISEAHSLIRNQLEAWHKDLAKYIKILYGGSLKPGNASNILSLDNVDGGLIGGASLKADDYLAIAAAVI